MKGSEKPHIVAVTFPALGHSIPFLDLSRLLASHGITVSYVTTPANVCRLQSPVADAVNNGLDIRLVILLPTPAVEGLEERESADLLPKSSQGLIFQLAEKLQQPFERWIEQQLEEEVQLPVCVVHDVFIMGWARESAQKYQISSVEFHAAGALLYVSRSILRKALEKAEEDSLDLAPRPLRFRRHEITDDFFDGDSSNPAMVGFTRRLLQSKYGTKGSGIVINTFEELEPAYVQRLKKLTGKPVWTIGPLLIPPDNYINGAVKINYTTRGKMADIGDDELVQWLDSQSPRSVVYVSFGSQTFLSEQQTNALARGLEACEQPFVWALKVSPSIEPASAPDSTAYSASKYLPHGFVERTKNRGLIIWGWAPQLVILSHPSVGAFMSHCGWNSTLESIIVGVPIIAWPMYGDQFFNVRLVAKLGMGIQFCKHRLGIPNEGKVEEVVRQAFNDDKGKDMRKNAEKLKQMARNGVEDGGSSNANMQAFASEMKKLMTMRVEREKTLLPVRMYVGC